MSNGPGTVQISIKNNKTRQILAIEAGSHESREGSKKLAGAGAMRT